MCSMTSVYVSKHTLDRRSGLQLQSVALDITLTNLCSVVLVNHSRWEKSGRMKKQVIENIHHHQMSQVEFPVFTLCTMNVYSTVHLILLCYRKHTLLVSFNMPCNSESDTLECVNYYYNFLIHLLSWVLSL